MLNLADNFLDSGEVLFRGDDYDFKGVVLKPAEEAAGEEAVDCAYYDTNIAGLVLGLRGNGDWSVGCEVVVEYTMLD
jgi:hypothetical protein